MEHWKIERQGKYITVNIEDRGKYVPLLIFTNFEYFGAWVKNIAEHCHEMVQLTEEIKKVCDSLQPTGAIYDYVKSLEVVDKVGKDAI